MSFGGHYGWLLDGAGEQVSSKALAASVWMPLALGIELRAEAFTGQALAGLGGGGTGQNMVRDGVPVRAQGGWIQLNISPAPGWELGGGAGIDDPDDSDLVAASRLRNGLDDLYHEQGGIDPYEGCGFATSWAHPADCRS